RHTVPVPGNDRGYRAAGRDPDIAFPNHMGFTFLYLEKRSLENKKTRTSAQTVTCAEMNAFAHLRNIIPLIYLPVKEKELI
ncbi:MAG: hypothetical protein IK132_13780, partial [Clostridia bacterium]|nr:hypothetical protein [Clostridia bacterium]